MIEFPLLYMPSHDAALFDVDNANADMATASEQLAYHPNDKHSAERYKAALDRFDRAVDIAWDARFRETKQALMSVMGRV